MTGIALAWRIAWRELRGGLAGFRVFLACLALGVGAIAAVGTVQVSLERGLSDQGAVLLGGDAEMGFTYRFASEDERRFMKRRAAAVSEVVDFRSMAVVGTGDTTERALTQVKGVDAAYPLLGQVELQPAMPLAEALAVRGGLPGGVMDKVLVDRLGMKPGDIFRLGMQDFRLTAALIREPDAAAGGFSLGPRTIVATGALLTGSELLGPGTLFETKYRLLLPEGASLPAVKARAEARFRDTGMRWQDRRNGAPGVSRFVERIGAFLVLVGLAGLAVGGVGVSAAVRSYLDGKAAVIATLRTLGAEGWLIFLIYLMQVGVLTAAGVVLGLILGAGVPLLFAPLIASALPIPVAFSVYPAPLAEAALYGVLTALLFTLWPLGRTAQVRAAALYRGVMPGDRRWPGVRMLVVLAAVLALLVAASVWFSGVPRLALGTAAGILGALVVLALAAVAVRWLARRGARARRLRGKTALRLALGAVGGPGEASASVILSLGLGLAVLAAVGQIDANLRRAIDRDLPDRAPSYFFVDIQGDQMAGFMDRLNRDPAVMKVESAPMLRGVITRINGRPAREVAGNHWVLRGDRGVTYADRMPANTTLTAGTWWPEGYQGPPLISFAAEEGAELGLKLGDRITVNILGRDIEATITSFREVDFSTAGIGFVLTMNPGALAGAPHTFISTVYATPEAEAPILRDLASAYPNITAIRIRDVVARVSEALGAIAAATSYAAAATLVTGFVVLIGAAAAGERARVFEAAVLKTIGATRGRILWSFALRSAVLGAAAGGVAVIAGGLAGWAVMVFVMEASFRFEPLSALAIILGGIVATLLAGLGFALRPLAARPARVLRAQD
jgi:putative ABC transport system permease protein